MKRSILLLTGTVNPDQMAFTKLLDPAKRKAQYIAGLHYWLRATTLPLVFVENSGTDLSQEISAEYADRIEFLTFQGNDYPKDLGKGYGELKCLEYAAQHSRFFKQCDFVFKVTGRLKIMNFQRLLNYYLQHDTTYVFLDFRRALTFADSRIFGFHPSFLSRYFLKRRHEINDSEQRIFENILAKAVLEAVIAGEAYRQFPYYPKFIGVSGTDNIPYRSDFVYFLLKRIQFFLKAKFMNN